MKNFLDSKLSKIFQRFISRDKIKPRSNTILFDSPTAAQDIAFMLGGEWDKCNGVTMPDYDEIAINTAAKLHNSSWCKPGDKQAVLLRLTVAELVKRYAIGERNFNNANLRCAPLEKLNFSAVNLSNAKLNQANLEGTNLSSADLTTADFSAANLTGVDLSKSSLRRANLTKADLSFANLRGANLQAANLSAACLYQTDLRGANLSLADLRSADLAEANLVGADLTNTQLTLTDAQKAALLIQKLGNLIEGSTSK